MIEKSKRVHRPRVIYFIALEWTLGAIVALLIAVIGLVFLLSPPINQQYDNSLNKCFYGGMVLAGLYGTAFQLWQAWAIYSLKPMGYVFVKTAKWSPLLWLVTGFGKRLDDRDVYEAFGLSSEEAKDWEKYIDKLRRK